MMRRKAIYLGLGLLALTFMLAACGPSETPTPEVIIETVEVPVPVEPEEPMEPAVEVPFLELWQGSGHNDATAEAFTHWDEDDPAVIPPSCAKCHSQPGYHDFLGLDGTDFGSVENDAAIGTTVNCVTCHNEVTIDMTSVVMPSGLEITGLGDEARCMQCHQGRESKVSVDEAIAEAGVDEDTVSEDLGFLNIHYFAAAATKYGTEAQGGYEYDDKSYDAFFVHVEGYEACDECHNPHTLELKVDECTACHSGATSAEDFRDVRMPASAVDYDGDGDVSEGVYYEVEGLAEKLYQAIQIYADEIAGSPVVYDAHSYPYFFTDTNADGEVGEDEANYGNRYTSWTPRLLKAAYNYQVSRKDPGGYAHGGKYIIQLLWDSTEDLNTVISSPVVLEDEHPGHSHRIDHGHFAGSEEAFRHWDEDDPAEVPGRCSRCHTAEGLPLFLSEGVEISQQPSNGLLCSTCHNDLSAWTRYEVASTTFPSGQTVDSGDPDMNLCMTCHQGRESGTSVDAALEGLPADTASEDIRFINIHYFAAGATIFGGEVVGGYEYPGETYVGRFSHVEGFNTCTGCHSAHELAVKFEACSSCHPNVEAYEDLHSIRISTVDYDGDGDAAEGLAQEIETLREQLYAAIQAYATDTLAAPIVYDSHSYPYFFADDGNGVVDEGEANYGNRYQSWSPRLLRAAYNYQYASKDPGAFAHNGKYTLQLLYDSLRDIGGSTAGLTRP